MKRTREIVIVINLPRVMLSLFGLILAGIVCYLFFIADTELACQIVCRSNADHGETMAEVISLIKDEPCEYYAKFVNGVKIFEYTNDVVNSVTLKDYSALFIKESDYCVDIHNHPLLGDGSDYSFSYGDLSTFFDPINQYIDQHIVVSASRVHILEAPNGWPSQDDLTQFFDDQYNWHIDYNPRDESHSDISVQQLQWLQDEGKIVIDQKGNVIIGIGFTSKMIAEIADHFGLIYTVKLLPNMKPVASGVIALPE